MSVICSKQLSVPVRRFTVNITEDNIENYFEVDNGGYYFVGEDGTFKSNNTKGQTATTTLTALFDMDVSFDYKHYCSGGTTGARTFTIYVDSTVILSSQAQDSGNYQCSLSEGQRITFEYELTNLAGSTSWYGSFSNMVVSGEV